MEEKDKRVDEVVQSLQKQGYKNIFLWRDKKGTYYPLHAHPYEEIRVVLDGELVIVEENGTRHHLRKGDRLKVSPGLRHEAFVLEDCKYICGSR
ncbi:MAG: cupin domain-containing protein [Epsilonproteobacteria bacterium]|jgi:quercetin dioxygenase-like cupin family protein|nr:cupin domain-containing protein [Campylobacterota bacterium]NPA89424.1 cupin domain-containing protein [Campylobacterota bacterium]